MPAFWELLAYRVDYERLIGLVGSGDAFRGHAKKILKSACARSMEEEDDRLEPPGLEGALEEIAQGGKALDDEHSTAYRISIEAIAENLAAKIEQPIAGYADRGRISEALRALGINTLAKVFDADDGLRFPWKKKSSEEWPWATFLDRTALTLVCDEITNLVCRADDIDINATRACWQSTSKKNLIVELKSPPKKKATTYALVTSKGVLNTGPLDDVLASVPTADFESAAMALAPKAPPRIWCASLRKGDRERIKATLNKKLKLDEYDEDLIDCTITLLEIVKAYADNEPSSKSKSKSKRTKTKAKTKTTKAQTPRPLTSGNEKDGVLLYADGEQG